MKTEQKKCRVFDPDGHLKSITQHLAAEGWYFTEEDDDDTVVGLADVAAVHKQAKALPPIPWVGVLDREHLNDPELVQFVLHCFVDFHTYPIDYTRLSHGLGHLVGLRILSVRLRNSTDYGQGLVGEHPSMRLVTERIAKFAHTDHTVLIEGESGTGKEVVARAIHDQSARADGPWVAVNCAALPENLIHAELFGASKGAYTSAENSREGKFEAANGGTLFLDEIGDMPLSVQASLLRALEEKTISRLGCNKEIKLDVRIVAATNAKLEGAVQRGQFRSDLFYRLCALRIDMPALRERGRDILLLADTFLTRLAEAQGHKGKRLTTQARWALLEYNWPGNVRELKNRVTQGFVMSESDFIDSVDMGFYCKESTVMPSLNDVRDQAEQHYLERLITVTNRNISQASEQAGISRVQLYRLMNKHGFA